MQICRRNSKPLIAVFSLIVLQKLCVLPSSLPPGRASAAAVLPHSDLSSEIRMTRNKIGRREGKEGAGAPSPPNPAVCGMRIPWTRVRVKLYRAREGCECVGLENANLLCVSL